MTVFNCECDTTYPRETLATLRTRLIRRLGFSAQAANPPPGMTELLDDFLQEAQRLVYSDYAYFRTARWFTWTLEDGERFYDFGNDDGAAIPPPTTSNITITRQHTGGILTDVRTDFKFTWVNAQGETVGSETFIVPTELTGDTTCRYKIDWTPPEVDDCLGPITSIRIYVWNGTIFKLYFTKDAGDGTYTFEGDEGVPLDDTEPPETNGATAPPGSILALDPEKIKRVEISDADDGDWRPLARGIDPSLYSLDVTGDPTCYEVRGCIELWPIPDAAGAKLRVLGHFGLRRFTQNTDYTTCDPDMIFLRALANAKAHYRQPDAGNYIEQEQRRLHQLVSMTHQGQRYVPGKTRAPGLRPIQYSQMIDPPLE